MLLIACILRDIGTERIDPCGAHAHLLHAKVREFAAAPDINLDRNVCKVGIACHAHMALDEGQARSACDLHLQARVGGGDAAGSVAASYPRLQVQVASTACLALIERHVSVAG